MSLDLLSLCDPLICVCSNVLQGAEKLLEAKVSKTLLKFVATHHPLCG